ncbi:MAG TPA: hypothetical protein VMW65_17115 [Chloroflexota bacterium]|nr:hypothetical protein [Chloroflexota bacterium]
MSELPLHVADDQTVEIRGNGDLTILGTDGDVIRVFGDDDDRPEINAEGDTVRLHFRGNVRLQIPRRVPLRIVEAKGDVDVRGREAPVELHDVRGDAAFREITGAVTGAEVAGDLMIQRVSGAVSLEKISGDASLAAIDGVVVVRRIEGDLDVRDCQDSVGVDNVGGHLSGRNLAGGLRASHVGGDAKLSGEFTPGNVYDLTCGGSATIALSGDPASASVLFELKRGSGGSIKVGLPLSNVTQGPGTLTGQLGAGEAIVQVTSGGDLKVSASGAGREWGGFFEDFADQLRSEITEEIGSGFEAAFGSFHQFGGPDLGERIREKTARISQRAEERARRTEENARRNAERIEQRAQEASRRVAERFERQAERRGGIWRTPPPPPRPAPPPRPQASDQERLVILQMLADGKISTEDAARLLEALGT